MATTEEDKVDFGKYEEVLQKWFPQINPKAFLDIKAFEELPKLIVSEALTYMISDLIIERKNMSISQKFFNGFAFTIVKMIIRFDISLNKVLTIIEKKNVGKKEYQSCKKIVEELATRVKKAVGE